MPFPFSLLPSRLNPSCTPHQRLLHLPAPCVTALRQLLSLSSPLAAIPCVLHASRAP
jgi:hypothetical protein